MSKKRLPIKLNKEPLIEVTCAVYFSSNDSAESLLPGYLLSKLEIPNPKFEMLGATQLPPIIRDSDPNLQNAPLMRIDFDSQHFILIGSKWLAVSCRIPYSGWSVYKNVITQVFSTLADAKFISKIEGYSLKYVDFISDQDNSSSLSVFDINIEIAGKKLQQEQTQLRVEVQDSDFVHAITIISKAILNMPEYPATEGSLLDVDTRRVLEISTHDFKKDLDVFLEKIHSANKKTFFSLLSDNGLQSLEPIYD